MDGMRRQLAILVLLIWSFALLDILITTVGVLGLGAVELNPIQHALGWPLFWTIKLVMTTVITAYLLVTFQCLKDTAVMFARIGAWLAAVPVVFNAILMFTYLH